MKRKFIAKPGRGIVASRTIYASSYEDDVQRLRDECKREGLFAICYKIKYPKRSKERPGETVENLESGLFRAATYEDYREQCEEIANNAGVRESSIMFYTVYAGNPKSSDTNYSEPVNDVTDDSVFEMIDNNVDRVVSEVNDADFEKELWGEDFQWECISVMEDMLKNAGYTITPDVSNYLITAFSEYGYE